MEFKLSNDIKTSNFVVIIVGYVCMYLCMYVLCLQIAMHHDAYVEVIGQHGKVDWIFPICEFWAWTQFIWLGRKHLYLLSHFTGLNLAILLALNYTNQVSRSLHLVILLTSHTLGIISDFQMTEVRWIVQLKVVMPMQAQAGISFKKYKHYQS